MSLFVINNSRNLLIVQVYSHCNPGMFGQGNQSVVLPNDTRLVQSGRAKFFARLYHFDRAEERRQMVHELLVTIPTQLEVSTNSKTGQIELSTQPWALPETDPAAFAMLERVWKSVRELEKQTHYEILRVEKAPSDVNQLESTGRWEEEKARIDAAYARALLSLRKLEDQLEICTLRAAGYSLPRMISWKLTQAHHELTDRQKRKWYDVRLQLEEGIFTKGRWWPRFVGRTNDDRLKLAMSGFIAVSALVVGAVGIGFGGSITLLTLALLGGFIGAVGGGAFNGFLFALSAQCVEDAALGVNTWRRFANYCIAGSIVGLIAGVVTAMLPQFAKTLVVLGVLGDQVQALVLLSAGISLFESVFTRLVNHLVVRPSDESIGALTMDLVLAGLLGASLGAMVGTALDNVTNNIRHQAMFMGVADEVAGISAGNLQAREYVTSEELVHTMRDRQTQRLHKALSGQDEDGDDPTRRLQCTCGAVGHDFVNARIKLLIDAATAELEPEAGSVRFRSKSWLVFKTRMLVSDVRSPDEFYENELDSSRVETPSKHRVFYPREICVFSSSDCSAGRKYQLEFQSLTFFGWRTIERLVHPATLHRKFLITGVAFRERIARVLNEDSRFLLSTN